MKQKVVAILKFLLVLLFVVYYGEATLFVHTHHYKSYSITHSHPYMADHNGQPLHQHTGNQLQVIDHLTCLLLFFTLAMAALTLLVSYRRSCYLWNVVIRYFSGVYYFSLRAPPAIY